MSHSTTMRRASRGLVAGALVATLLAAGASGALADPTPPSAQDVQRAQGAVRSAERSVASMEVRLAELSAQTDAAELKVQQAGEAYNRAVVDADAAQQASDDAVARSTEAAATAEDARRQLVAIAREVARSGGSTDLLQALLSADGFQDVARRSTALDRISGKADEAVQEYRATQLVATTLAERATQAAAAAKAAKTVGRRRAGRRRAGADRRRRRADRRRHRARRTHHRPGRRAPDQRRGRAGPPGLRRPAAPRARGGRRPRSRPATRRRAADHHHRTGHPAGHDAAAGHDGSPRDAAAGHVSGHPRRPVAPPVVAPPVVAPPVVAPPVVTPPAPSNPYGLGTGRSRGSAAGGAAALAWAQTKTGLPYVWGGVGPDGYDCSGLTMSAWRTAGVNLSRTTRDQYKQVLKISYNDLRPGDLVFWSTDPNNPDGIYHVAIWAGNGQIMEASKPGDPLRTISMRWGSTMPFAGRP